MCRDQLSEYRPREECCHHCKACLSVAHDPGGEEEKEEVGEATAGRQGGTHARRQTDRQAGRQGRHIRHNMGKLLTWTVLNASCECSNEQPGRADLGRVPVETHHANMLAERRSATLPLLHHTIILAVQTLCSSGWTQGHDEACIAGLVVYTTAPIPTTVAPAAWVSGHF